MGPRDHSRLGGQSIICDKMANTLDHSPDGGYGWVIVFVTHINMVIVGGVLSSLGIFIPKFMEQFENTSSEASMSLVTSLCFGITLFSGK